VKALEHSPCSPDLSLPDFFLFPQLESVFKGQRFVSIEEVAAKVTRDIEKFFQGMLPVICMNVGKSVPLPKGTTLKEIFVNRCKFTYFCVLNRFWKLFV
jgi:hypothetical protein